MENNDSICHKIPLVCYVLSRGNVVLQTSAVIKFAMSTEDTIWIKCFTLPVHAIIITNNKRRRVVQTYESQSQQTIISCNTTPTKSHNQTHNNKHTSQSMPNHKNHTSTNNTKRNICQLKNTE